MPPKFTQQVIQNKKSKNGAIQRKTIRLKAKNNNMINFNDIRQFYNGLIDSGEEAHKISISGMNIDKYLTMKSFTDIDLKPFDEDEYYANRTGDTAKYESFFYVDLYLK
jgi:hypothetical protein